ncbi:MAG: CPBP family intramembrane glutamic endopeptidase [Woeseiaceae bacterium]
MQVRTQSTAPRIRVSIAVILLFQVSALFLRSILEVQLVRNGFNPVAAKYIGALLGLFALGIFLAPVIRSLWPALMLQFLHSGRWFRLVIASVTLGTSLWIINAQVMLLLGVPDGFTTADQTQQATAVFQFECAAGMMLLLAVPVMSLATPVIEEICSRGLILQTLLPQGRIRAILISSILFSLLHKPEAYATAFLFGLFVAVQALNWRSLWGPIITHGTFNLLVELDRACMTAYWLPGRLLWESGSALVQAVTISVVCLCVSCLLVSGRRLGAT